MEPQQLLRILRRRGRKIIVWGIALAVLVGAASFVQKASYRASAQVLLQPNNTPQSATQPVSPVDIGTYAAAQVTIAHSLAVAQAASAFVPGKPSPVGLLNQVSVSADATTGLLTIAATSGNRSDARAIANAFAQAYVASNLANAIGGLQTAIDGMQPQLDALIREIGTLDTQIGAASKTSASAALLGPLTAHRDAVLAQYQILYGDQSTLKNNLTLTRPQAEIIAAAGLPGSPVSPKPVRDAALGALAGLLIGAGVELLREKLDDKFDGAEEIEALTARPLLGQIPEDGAVAGAASPVVLRVGEFSEAVRALRTSLQFLGHERPLRRIVVSSPGAGDGKTTVAAHLAVAYAEAGFVTVLISGDLRRPQVEALFGASNFGMGLSTLLATGTLRPRTAPDLNGHHENGNGNGSASRSYLADEGTPAERAARLQEFLHLLAMETEVTNLTLIPAGPTPPNPAELLGSARMYETLDALAARADVLIIDTPPALVVTDSVALAGASDGVLIVLSASKSTRSDLKRLMAIYDTADVPVLGAVLNRVESNGKSDYYNTYRTPAPAPAPRVSRFTRKKGTTAPI